MKLIIYRVALLNKANEEQVLSRFNGENDLFTVCNHYYHSLKKNRLDYIDSQGNKRVFYINSEIDFLISERTLITYFDSAYTGDEPEIRNGKTNALNYKVSNTELITKKLFSLFYIPENSKYGYVIFENKAKHGVKVMFERQLQAFLKTSGYIDYRVVLTPALNYNYLSNFINNGLLKKVRLIVNVLKKDIQLTLWNDVDYFCTDKDIREFNFKSRSRNTILKDELYNLFFSRLNSYDKIHFMNKYDVDDISFEINKKGETKTFYIKDRSRMRSIIDVYDLLEYVDSDPTYSSMIEVSLSMIKQIIGFNSLNFEEAA
ncbi:hypothetical protein FPF71_02195 [Algibacter amylolyticus]|uniref:DUF4747 family protein n=1 Tax=Algibacter amylolyticus TaxID=1608400 RepID=A0A5M7BJ96_9FLAO|nr:hypothetical protein [Algibacter amylolyticus]KAA5827674.1 hypothetical protein F2B50_02195 [Algibacter amylolyticus]MBB5266889.1 hypothetical protein [Algibacter amylolyticus]TSJ81919.1 hypothetical protein FPF71_02195 [Algibacter amylolyticus]